MGSPIRDLSPNLATLLPTDPKLKARAYSTVRRYHISLLPQCALHFSVSGPNADIRYRNILFKVLGPLMHGICINIYIQSQCPLKPCRSSEEPRRTYELSVNCQMAVQGAFWSAKRYPSILILVHFWYCG